MRLNPTIPDLDNIEIAFKHLSNRELKRNLFIFKTVQKPLVSKLLTNLALLTLRYHLPFKSIVKKSMYDVFCAGENKNEVLNTIIELRNDNIKTVLDYVAEGDSTEEGIQANFDTILKNIDLVSKMGEGQFVGVKLSSLINTSELKKFIRVLSNEQLLNTPEGKHFLDRIDAICQRAKEKSVFVFIDAEEFLTQYLFDEVVLRMMRKYNKEQVVVFNTLQMYLVDRLVYLEELIDDATSNSYFLGLKLVRGAYVEQERKLAKEEHRKSPISVSKEETDQRYNDAVKMCLKHHEKIKTCLATHNKESIEIALQMIDEYAISDHRNKVFFSQLYGMSDTLTYNLSKLNYNVSKYVPYGELEKAIPYLLRRSEENSSIGGQSTREYDLLYAEKIRRQLK